MCVFLFSLICFPRRLRCRGSAGYIGVCVICRAAFCVASMASGACFVGGAHQCCAVQATLCVLHGGDDCCRVARDCWPGSAGRDGGGVCGRVVMSGVAPCWMSCGSTS